MDNAWLDVSPFERWLLSIQAKHPNGEIIPNHFGCEVHDGDHVYEYDYDPDPNYEARVRY